jgi:hypothetical protein
MEVPIIIFLYIYFGLAAVCGLFFLANLYHVIRFGTLNFGTVFMSFIFIAGLVLLVYFSYSQIQLINWQQKIEISNWLPFYKLKPGLPQIIPNFENFQTDLLNK